MNNNNYITEEETVKIKIEDWMLLSQQDRQSHLDLTTECEYYYYTKDYGTKKIGDLYSDGEQLREAKRRLLNFHNIEEFGGYNIHLAHKCDNHSNKDKVCCNPLHLYFSTAKENHNDIPEDIRKEVTSKAGKIGGKKLKGLPKSEEHKKNLSKPKNWKDETIELYRLNMETRFKNGTHINQIGQSGFQKTKKCIHCGKETTCCNINRWHNDNCKFKT
jgi:hypothetical protein